MQKQIEHIRRTLAKNEWDAFLITSPLNRRYITGFTGTSGMVMITKEEQLLITDGRYVLQAEQQAPTFTLVKHEEKILEEVAAVCRKFNISSVAFEEEHINFAEYRELNERMPAIQFYPTLEWVESLRMIKDESELKYIRDAAAIVDQTFTEILKELKPGVSENEIAFKIELLMRKYGASGPSFSTIVASGYRSAYPHGFASEKKLAKGDFVLMDFGAYFEGYTSDITRTVVLGKEITNERNQIYQVVLEAQEKTIAAIRPKLKGKEIDQVARSYITSKGYGDYFGHATGHGLGLDVHENPTLRKSSDYVLEAGMVVTVEPGIYVPEIGGVRIEDDVVVTETGTEILTKSPKQLMFIDCE